MKASEIVQKYIRLHMINMIKSIGMKSSDLNKLVREFPPGGETLVIRILVILCESSKSFFALLLIISGILIFFFFALLSFYRTAYT
jgi:hypothetical protein